MFAKIFTLFALMAVAFAAPNPKPEPKPQYLATAPVAYTSGLDYAAPVVYPGYSSPLAYSAYAAPAAVPAYSPLTYYYR